MSLILEAACKEIKSGYLAYAVNYYRNGLHDWYIIMQRTRRVVMIKQINTDVDVGINNYPIYMFDKSDEDNAYPKDFCTAYHLRYFKPLMDSGELQLTITQCVKLHQILQSLDLTDDIKAHLPDVLADVSPEDIFEAFI